MKRTKIDLGRIRVLDKVATVDGLRSVVKRLDAESWRKDDCFNVRRAGSLLENPMEVDPHCEAKIFAELRFEHTRIVALGMEDKYVAVRVVDDHGPMYAILSEDLETVELPCERYAQMLRDDTYAGGCSVGDLTGGHPERCVEIVNLTQAVEEIAQDVDLPGDCTLTIVSETGYVQMPWSSREAE